MSNVYVVVGGAKVDGIGFTITELLSQSGKVVMTGFNQAEVDDGNAALKAKNIDAVSVVCDVMKQDDISNLVKVAAASGKIKGVVIVTGLTPICGNWEAIIRVSLLGVVNMMKAISEVMESDSAFVLFGSSSQYQLPRDLLNKVDPILYDADMNQDQDFMQAITPFIMSMGEERACGISYPVSKRGIQLMTRKYAVLLGEKKIRVNAISPGIINTENNRIEYEMSLETPEKRMWNMVNTMTPSKRMGDRMEIATVIEFLLSEKASFVNGLDILIDGGCMANMRLKKLVDQF